MLVIKISFDTRAALALGLARQGEGAVHLSDADVASLTQEQRDALPLGDARAPCLPDATLPHLVAWLDRKIANDAAEAAQLAADGQAALAALASWSDAVDAHLASCPSLEMWTYTQVQGQPSQPSVPCSVHYHPTVSKAREAVQQRISDYCKPLAEQRKQLVAQQKRDEEARRESELQRQEQKDLQWADESPARAPLLAFHVAAGVRGAKLRKATRKAQIEVELTPEGWVPVDDKAGNVHDTDLLPGLDEYGKLSQAKAQYPDTEIRRWKDYAACRHGGCDKCDSDNEHPRYSWVLSREWRGETVVQNIG